MTARPAPRRLALTLGALAAALALTACDLRLETEPPAEPTPRHAEQVRERAVDDALALAAAARSAQSLADEATAAVLADVARFSSSQAERLGGAYDSGLPRPTDTATATPVGATPDQVLAALRLDAAAALADATANDDGAMARLLVAVGVARDELATRLAAALNEPAAAPAPTDAAPAPTPAASGGLPADEVAPLVLAHDQAGFGLEVVAARLSGDQRTAAATAAAAHRATAEQWARRSGIAATGDDPRRAVYALPADVGDPQGARALAAGLETAVANAASAAIVRAPADARAELIDEVTAATGAAAGWGAAPVAFPGIAELG